MSKGQICLLSIEAEFILAGATCGSSHVYGPYQEYQDGVLTATEDCVSFNFSHVGEDVGRASPLEDFTTYSDWSDERWQEEYARWAKVALAMRRKPCRRCEGERHDGFICDGCGRRHFLTADGRVEHESVQFVVAYEFRVEQSGGHEDPVETEAFADWVGVVDWGALTQEVPTHWGMRVEKVHGTATGKQVISGRVTGAPHLGQVQVLRGEHDQPSVEVLDVPAPYDIVPHIVVRGGVQIGDVLRTARWVEVE